MHISFDTAGRLCYRCAKQEGLTVLKGLGGRLRGLRKQRGLTLVQVAKASKVAVSTLSRMECGRMVGTLKSHMRLCRALGIHLADLYAGLDEPHAPVSVRRARDRTDICRHNDKVVQRVLTPGFLRKKIFPSLLEIAPGGETVLEQTKPDVEKFCYVISGKVRCLIGQEVHELGMGDAVYFTNGQPHWMENLGATLAKILCVAVPLAL